MPHCWNMGKFKTFILFIFTGTTQISGELLLAVLRHTLDIFPISRTAIVEMRAPPFPVSKQSVSANVNQILKPDMKQNCSTLFKRIAI